MKAKLLSLLVVLIAAINVMAQDHKEQLSPAEQEMISLSNDKWQWMSDKNIEKLADLFHDTSQFVHMGGYWGKEAELNTIKDGHIWYKKAEIHSQEVKFTDHTAGYILIQWWEATK